MDEQPPPYSEAPSTQQPQELCPDHLAAATRQQPLPPYPGQQPLHPYPGQVQQPYPGQQPRQPYPGQAQQPYPGKPTIGKSYPGQFHQSNIEVSTAPSGSLANSYLGFAICTCIFCCWPIGIAAIIFAVRTNDENGRGNYAAARRNSEHALWCSMAALIFGTTWLIIVIVMAVN